MDYRSAKGMLRADEADHLYALARALPAQAQMVNIGVEYGKSCVCLRQGCPTATLYAVDVDFKPLTEAVRAYLGTNTQLIQQDSLQYVPQVVAENALRLDLAFVDGLHYQAFVRNDACLSELVVPGGYLIFHDAYWWDYLDRQQPEVYPPIQEWFAAQNGSWQELPQVGTMRTFRRLA